MKNSFTQKLIVTLSVISCFLTFLNGAQAYEHEVWKSGNLYYWKTFDVERGSSSSLATALQGAIGSGSRDVHVLTGGTLSAQINLQSGLNLYCHDNTFDKNHGGYAFHREGSGSIGIYDMTLNNNTNMGIRTSRASNITIENVRIYGGSIGIRIDSHPSRPYEAGRWVSNLSVQNCRFENGSGHGLETYGVDGISVDGIIARNMGECGVLLNKTVNGTIGTVNAYRCSYGGGYAGLRFANNCSNITADMLYAEECGRGYFVLTGSNNCRLKNCEITNCTNIGIWLENVTNCVVDAGCTNSGVAVSGSGSSANVTSSCGSSSGTIVQFRNRGTGLYLDGMGRTTNGAACAQYANTTSDNAKWELISTAGNTRLRNVGTGLYLDGMGRTTNGADVGQYANTTHVNAQWSVQQYSGNYYRIQNVSTGLYLDGMGRTSNGSACAQYANTTSNNAQWERIVTSARLASGSNNTPLGELEASELSIYPNPATEQITISLPERAQGSYQLLTPSGVIVSSGKFEGKTHQVKLSKLSSGLYILITKTNDGDISKRKVTVK